MPRTSCQYPHLALIVLLSCTSAAVVSSRSHADARPGRYVIKPTTVYDTKTKLTWQQAVAPSPLNFSDAEAYCKSLPLGGLMWRLPGLKELETLVDESRVNPAIDRTAFPDTPGKVFWSATRVTNFPGSGWTVDFNRGGDSFVDITFTELVRCVHSG